MSIDSFEPRMILAILPEIMLLVLTGVLVAFDAVWKPEKRRGLGWIAFSGLAAIIIIMLLVSRPSHESRLIFGGMLHQDWYSFAFKLLFIFGAAVTSLLAMDIKELGDKGEFYALMLVSVLGMNLMSSAADIIMLYLAIETTSIPLYMLAGFFTRDQKSTESGFKYFLFGAAASAVMLYGFSLLYGFTATTNIYQITLSFYEAELPTVLILGSLLLILVGFGFKVSVVPFHFWAPDVYEGAPTPVAGFLSTASKAAGFAVLVRMLMIVFSPVVAFEWTSVIALISVFTMTIGNIIALAQKNIKRLLAYSSIAHAGYILIGLVAYSQLGTASVVFYLIGYLITNLAAFGIVSAFWQVEKTDEISAYAGLSRRAPGLGLGMMVAFLSLAGMPPLVGFVAKVFVFAAAIQAGYIWLAVIGVLNSIVGLYYYLTVLKVVYLYRSDKDDVAVPVTSSSRFALTILTIGILLLGTLFAPWYEWSMAIAKSLF